MEWTDSELDELATFFAKRLTVDLEPLDPTDPPPPGDPSGLWRDRLRTARDRGSLGRLANRIAAACPDDANLQQACELLNRDGSGGRNAMQVLGAALSVGAAVGFVGAGLGVATLYGLWSMNGPQPIEPAADLQPQARVVAEPTAIPDPYENLPDPQEQARVEDGTEDEVEVADEAVEVAQVEPAQAPVVPTVWREQNPQARCEGREGELVGYWYAGEKRPGRAGQRVVLDKTVNVRADYPARHNDFDKRSTVRCVLVEGDVVKLARSPIEVPGEAYWVPLVAGTVKPGKRS